MMRAKFRICSGNVRQTQSRNKPGTFEKLSTRTLVKHNTNVLHDVYKVQPFFPKMYDACKVPDLFRKCAANTIPE